MNARASATAGRLNADRVIDHLGYDRSRAFLRDADFDSYPGYAFALRRAVSDCGLRGVYTLRDRAGSSLVPLVYVCEAEDERQARAIHRRVWNQNIVPFLIVATPWSIRLYPGFRYQTPDRTEERDGQALLELLEVSADALAQLDDFASASIDEGRLWDRWGAKVTPETRVDWALLDQLEQLGNWLRQNGLEPNTAHTLIGKYVYLRYLRDRDILSDRKLEEWQIKEDAVFGRNASLEGFLVLVERLENWLNGSVFPLSGQSLESIRPEHVQEVASVFKGDQVAGQMGLDFRRYDFAQIPIETLSVVYEQFLHAEGRGREKSAYYTPVHLVNFMLDELEARRPLKPGMKVLDPACGSGAFLVQCFRRLVERQRAAGGDLRPEALRELLTEHVFGLDQDQDACRVAGLSLVLGLLDYLDPPDLNRHSGFKIPSLLGQNIVEGDFFADGNSLPDARFDWIVSNPPWKELKPAKLSSDDRAAFDWMNRHRKESPVGGNQLAEAFAWKVADHVEIDGLVALLVPAMILFKTESAKFRRRFFEQWDVWAVANFANLAEVLFAGRSRVPAAVLFYSPRSEGVEQRAYIDTYAPFLVNQEIHVKGKRRERASTWNIVVNGGELREVSIRDAMTGDSLPWKVAMWGSIRDSRLLRRLERQFENLGGFLERHRLLMSEGPQLRHGGAEDVVFVPELIGKEKLEMDKLRGRGRLFSFPSCVKPLVTKTYVRKGRVRRPLSICYPPHIVIDASRRFAVYSDEFLVVPARQVGIAGKPEQSCLLKALALFLSSDFVRYHQIFNSAQWGIQKSIANMENLKQLPMPLDRLDADTLNDWAKLHDQLVHAERESRNLADNSLFSTNTGDSYRSLLAELNDRVYALLDITPTERYLVEDLVHYRLRLNQGKCDPDLMNPPEQVGLQNYAAVLCSELDAFMGEDAPERHRIRIYRNRQSAVLEIELIAADRREASVQIQEVGERFSNALESLREHLRRDHGQWIYFERNLTIFDGPRTYLLKPLQRLQWLRSQALIDADNLIADTLAASVA